jgi:AcrR family transcriptional regulator
MNPLGIKSHDTFPGAKPVGHLCRNSGKAASSNLQRRITPLSLSGRLEHTGTLRGTHMLRKIPKEQRKKKILDGVEKLILQKASTDFTMYQLAEFVGISPTTFYNLFGSKGAVLYSLLNQGLDQIINGREEGTSSEDPVSYAIYSMTYAAEIFVEKTQLYRPLYKFQLGERDMGARPFYLDRGLSYWKRCLDGLVQRGYLQDDPTDGSFSRDDVALALLTHSSGTIDLWVQEDLDDEEFVARMTHDAALIIYAVVPETERQKIRDIVEATRPHIRKFSFLKKNAAPEGKKKQ